MCAILTAPGQDRPHDSGHFIGQRAGDDIGVTASQQGLHPYAERIGSCPIVREGSPVSDYACQNATQRAIAVDASAPECPTEAPKAKSPITRTGLFT